ncbi:hypothetical protein KFE25_008859 [Diacronema lutheri]|uniref:Globin domain-containing protein n=1 Tax=Diacronema lutheri TaxID=2081491 RepID=A0A8J6CJX4_DIALT|nr:hypothetical protein KFE25_008859 [Diacronema lutheri]
MPGRAAVALRAAGILASAAGIVALAVAIRRRRRVCRAPLRRRTTEVGGGFELPESAPAPPSIHGSPGLALTRQTVEVISSSVPVIGSTEAASIFYTELFAIAPELKALFGSPEAQQRKLRGILTWVSGVLTDMPSLSEGLRSLGVRHLRYNAKLEHFHAVKSAFMQMVSIVDQQSISSAAHDFDGTDSEADDEDADEDDADEEERGAGRAGARRAPIDRHQRLLDVSRAWEALLYVFIGEMSPMMLMQDTIGSFHAALANDLAAPAGGTCLALAGAQGASLLIMAAQLTREPRQRETIDRATKQLQHARTSLETLAKLDMCVYCRVMAAIRQPALTYPIARLRAISAALEQAALIPLQVAEWAVHTLRVARALLPIAGMSGVGDAGAGSYLLLAAGRAAIENVWVNTGSKLAAQGWRGWAHAIDARARELLDMLDDVEGDIKAIQAARNPRDG